MFPVVLDPMSYTNITGIRKDLSRWALSGQTRIRTQVFRATCGWCYCYYQTPLPTWKIEGYETISGVAEYLKFFFSTWFAFLLWKQEREERERDWHPKKCFQALSRKLFRKLEQLWMEKCFERRRKAKTMLTLNLSRLFRLSNELSCGISSNRRE